MSFQLIPLTADQLSKQFNPQTVLLLCTHICHRLLNNADLPVETTQEDKHKIQVILERIRIYLGNIGRFDTDNNVAETPRIAVMCITLLQRPPGGQGSDTVIAQFDLTQEGLAEVQPSHVLTFLLVLLKESVQSMRTRYPQTQRLQVSVTEFLAKVDQWIQELAPIVGAPPAWARGPNVIDPQTTILLRLRVGSS